MGLKERLSVFRRGRQSLPASAVPSRGTVPSRAASAHGNNRDTNQAGPAVSAPLAEQGLNAAESVSVAGQTQLAVTTPTSQPHAQVQQVFPQILTVGNAISGQDLWQAAFQQLQKAAEDKDGSSDEAKRVKVLGEVVQHVRKAGKAGSLGREAGESIKKAQEAYEQEHGMRIKIRKGFEATVKVLDVGKQMISDVASANPYAAAAWTAASFILPFLLAPSIENEDAMEGLSHCLHLAQVYRWHEESYIAIAMPDPSMVQNVTDIYTLILKFEADLLLHRARHAITRGISNIVNPESWKSRVKKLDVLDDRFRYQADAVRQRRELEWRAKEHEWQGNLIRRLDKAKQQEHLADLYRASRYPLIKDLPGDRVAGTCDWFLTHPHYISWKTRPDQAFLWLSAAPGLGKSVLAKYLLDCEAEALQRDGKRPTFCYFFFQSARQNDPRASEAICALIHQLVLQVPDLYEYLGVFMANFGDVTDFSRLWDVFLTIIESKHVKHVDVLCVIDGIDECSDRSVLQPKIAQLIRSLSNGLTILPRFKIIMTSRPWEDIILELQDIVDNQPECHITADDHMDAIKAGINAVIQKGILRLENRRPRLKDKLETVAGKLMDNEDRSYLWDNLVLQDIEAKSAGRNVASIETLVNGLPPGLPEYYQKLIRQSADPERTQRLFEILLVTRRRMSIRDIDVILNFNGEVSDIDPPISTEDEIRKLGCLCVHVVGGHVQFLHATVRSFLSASAKAPYVSSRYFKSLNETLQFAVSSQKAHHTMADFCVRYICHSNWSDHTRQEVYATCQAWRSLHKASQDWPLYDPVIIEKADPTTWNLLYYATVHWSFHLEAASPSEDNNLLELVYERSSDKAGAGYLLWAGVRLFGPSSTETWDNLAGYHNLAELWTYGTSPLRASISDQATFNTLRIAASQNSGNVVDHILSQRSIIPESCSVECVDAFVNALRQQKPEWALKILDLGLDPWAIIVATLEPRSVSLDTDDPEQKTQLKQDYFNVRGQIRSLGYREEPNKLVLTRVVDKIVNLPISSSDQVTRLRDDAFKLCVEHDCLEEAVRLSRLRMEPMDPWKGLSIVTSHDAKLCLEELCHQCPEIYSSTLPGSLGDLGLTALHQAFRNGAAKCIQWLLEHGANITATTRLGRTPLHFAKGIVWKSKSEIGDVGIFLVWLEEILKSKGITVDVKDATGLTPLATLLNQLDHPFDDLCDRLIRLSEVFQRCGADINSTDNQGICIVERLCRKQCPPGLWAWNYLWENPKVNVNQTASSGRSLLTHFLSSSSGRYKSNFEVIETFLKHGADVNLPDNNGKTVLHHLCESSIYSRNIDLVLSLPGLKLDQCDLSGMTPMMLALRNRDLILVGKLKRAGADATPWEKYKRAGCV